MPQLVDQYGSPINSSMYKKDKAPKMGAAFGDWAGRDNQFATLPGGSVMQFDLDRLTLADYRAMRTNPQVSSSLALLSFMIHQVDWWIECDDKKIKDEITRQLQRKWSQLIRAMSQSFWCGFSPTVIDWKNGDKYIEIERFKDLVPEECEVNWKTELGYAPPGKARPKFKKFNGIKQSWSSSEPVEVNNSFWYPLLMENGNYYGRKLLKAAFTPWYFSTLVHLFSNRYYERFGEPTPIGRAPLDSDFDLGGGNVLPARDAMMLLLQSIRNRSVVVLPNDRDPMTKEFDYEIEYLESQMRGADFERYLSRLDEEISLAIFTPILMFRTGDVGSNALGVQHVQTFLWMLNALAADMKEYIDAYIIDRIKGFNWGPKAKSAEWKWKPLGKENAETIRALAVEMVRNGTAKVNYEQMGKALGMEISEIKVVTQPPPEPGSVDANGNPKPAPDNRGARDKPKSDGPQTVGKETRQTSKSVAARISSQVAKAWGQNKFGTDEFTPTLGYQRRMITSLMADTGMAEDAASEAVDRLYSNLNTHLEAAISIGRDEYAGHQDFMALFERRIELELEDMFDAS